MEHKIKRCLSLILLAFAGSMLIVSMTTDSWWQQAIPKRPKDISKSVIYRWKSLTEDCLFFPPIIPVAKCSVLKQEGWLLFVRYSMYTAMGLSGLEVLIIAMVLLVKKKLYMDFITLFSLIPVTVATTALSVYTHFNPTHFDFFKLHGYSYICGWLGVTSLCLASLFSFLSRKNKYQVSLSSKPRVNNQVTTTANTAL